LVKVGAKVLCRFEKITALEFVTGNVNVGGLPTISVGQVQRGLVEKVHAPMGPVLVCCGRHVCDFYGAR